MKQLTSLLERVTHVGASELLLGPEEISFKSFLQSPGDMHPKIVGALLEHQYESLLPNRHKDGVKDVLIGLLKDALDVYDSKTYPVRRMRVLLKGLEFYYRNPNPDGLGDVDDLASEATSLGILSPEVSYIFTFLE